MESQKLRQATNRACKKQFFDNLLFLIKEGFKVKPERDYYPRFLYIYFGSLQYLFWLRKIVVNSLFSLQKTQLQLLKMWLQVHLVCVCLDFLKPKTRINEKVGNKMRLAESKTRFIYGPLRSINENALLGVFGLLPLDVAFTKMSLIYLTQTHKLISSLTLTHLISLLFTSHALTPTPPSLA